MTTKSLETPSDSQELIRRAAFRLLLTHSAPIDPDQLATATGINIERLSALLDQLDAAGRIRRDESCRVIGSAGLSVIPDRHQVELDGRKFWTWCAYDIVGIFGALRASGRALSPSPAGRTIEVIFDKGRPVDNGAVLFRPDEELMTRCENVYEEWCPNSNLFADVDHANRWAEQRGLRGRVLGLDEASDLGTTDWAGVI